MKILIPVALAALAAVVWLLLQKPAVKPVGPGDGASAAAEPAGTDGRAAARRGGDGEDAPASGAARDVALDRRAKAPAGEPGALAALPGTLPDPPPVQVVSAPPANPSDVVKTDMPPAIDLAPGSLYGRKGTTQMAEIGVVQVQDSVRKFFGNLPKSGRGPKRVVAEELLPADLLKAMNIPGNSDVVMLGELPIEDRDSYDRVLGPNLASGGMLGISFRTPDGANIRDYVRVLPQP